MGAPVVKTDALYPAPEPEEVEGAETEAPAEEPPPEPEPPAKQTRRKRGGASAASGRKPKLKDEDYQRLGELTALAHKEGVSPGELVAHWRKLSEVWEKMEKSHHG